MTEDLFLNDAGAYIPYAKKHLVEQRDKDETNIIRLAEIWEEPDWIKLVDSGMSSELAAQIYFGYHALRNKPRDNGVRSIDGKKWKNAYVESVLVLKKLYSSAHSIEKYDSIKQEFLNHFGYTLSALKSSSVETCINYWAVGYGEERILKSPFSGSLRLQQICKWMFKMGWPHSQTVLKVGVIPVKLSKPEGKYLVCKVEGKALKPVIEEYFDTEEKALENAIRYTEKLAEDKVKQTKLVPKRIPVPKNASRIGEDFRKSADITPDQLMQEFSIRGIQYGNSVSISDRQLWVNQTYDSLADLAVILGMKNRWIGLPRNGNSLALAIGARGKGAGNAHYEINLKVINQTYRNGVGTLAHEYGHALDHRISATLGYAGCFATNWCFWNAYAEMDDPKLIPLAKALYELGKLLIGRNLNFYQNALKISTQHRAGKYWIEPHELFARSFESYIQDQLSEQGYYNPWLVHGTLKSDFNPDRSIACAYPIDEERLLINEKIKQIIYLLLNPKH